MKTQRFLPHAVLALLLLIVPLMLAATDIGRIKGTVTDAESGDPLGGVSVLIKGTSMGAKTNFDGDFIIISVPPGTYDLILSSIGYEKVEVTNVVVNKDQTTEINVEMKQTVLDMGNVNSVTGQRKEVDFNQTGTVSIVAALRKK